ncbi:sensor histidine kinase [bacterium]|nr:sensor histidine kinase [bacterium]
MQLAYPVLVLCTGLAGDVWARHWVLVILAALLLSFLGAFRNRVGTQMSSARTSRLPTLRRAYSALVLSQGLVWSAFTTSIVAAYGRSWTGLAAILFSVGIVAGSTASLTPSFAIMRAYIAVTILPTAIGLVGRGTPADLALGATLLTYFYFMCEVGRRNADRHKNLSQTLLRLEDAQDEADQHRQRWQDLAEQLRHLSARQLEAVEKERLHVAREVHDDLGQLLTALKISLARTEKLVVEDSLQTRLREMNELVDATMASVRRISGSLRPPLLDELGLVPALDRFLSESLQRAKLDYRLTVSEPMPNLSKDQSLAAFRICQEAITNVLRHSQARSVAVRIAARSGDFCIEVSDDGVGASIDPLKPALGLLGLRERVHLLGGKLTVISAPGQGTQLMARFPIQAPEAPQGTPNPTVFSRSGP